MDFYADKATCEAGNLTRGETAGEGCRKECFYERVQGSTRCDCEPGSVYVELADMKTSFAVGAFLITLCLAHPAQAEDAAGRWAVAGTVDGTNFTLDCRFEQAEHNLTGACIDGPTGDSKVEGGRSHALLEGQSSAGNISWTYQSSYLLFKFDVKYAGTRDGDHMSGTIAAAGKTGTFTANRVNP